MKLYVLLITIHIFSLAKIRNDPYFYYFSSSLQINNILSNIKTEEKIISIKYISSLI
jgi:hypothetical protein